MKIVYNSPDHAKQRMEVVPPTMTEIKVAVSMLNQYIPKPATATADIIQRLIWHYENLEHASQTQPKWISVDVELPENINDVLISVSGSIGIGFYRRKDQTWYWGDLPCTPLFWQPLPEPPKTK